jgi:hypothetical protein
MKIKMKNRLIVRCNSLIPLNYYFSTHFFHRIEAFAPSWHEFENAFDVLVQNSGS